MVLSGIYWEELCSERPLSVRKFLRLVPGWTKSIVIGRHAHADQVTDHVITWKFIE